MIVSPECVAYIGKMGDYLRPGCEICAVAGSVELGMAADYLRAHSPGLTLKDARTGEKTLPVLIGREGRMEFAGR